MTLPLQTGYPDYGRFLAQSTKIYAQAVLPAVVANFTVDLGYVGDIAHLGARVVNIAGTFLATVNFYADAAKTINLGNHPIGFRDGDIFSRTLPVLGPFADVFFFVGTTPINMVYAFYQATVAYSALDTDQRTNVLFSAEPINIPVGATFVDCDRILPGPAALFVTLPAVASRVNVYSRDPFGAFTFLCKVDGNALQVDRHFFLPAEHIVLKFEHGGPGAQNFIASLTTDILRG